MNHKTESQQHHRGMLENLISRAHTSAEMPTTKMNVITRIKIVTWWLRRQNDFGFIALRWLSLNVTTRDWRQNWELKKSSLKISLYCFRIEGHKKSQKHWIITLYGPVKFVVVIELVLDSSSGSLVVFFAMPFVVGVAAAVAAVNVKSSTAKTLLIFSIICCFRSQFVSNTNELGCTRFGFPDAAAFVRLKFSKFSTLSSSELTLYAVWYNGKLMEFLIQTSSTVSSSI